MLEAVLQPKLQSSRPMGVHRTQERAAGSAVDIYWWTTRRAEEIGSQSAKRGIVWPAIAPDHIGSGIPNVGIENTKLCVVENVEPFGPELEFASLADFKRLQKRHVEIYTVRIRQKVTACISERESLGGSEGGRVIQKWPDATSTIHWCGQRSA